MTVISGNRHYLIIAAMVDYVPPWLIANFNAAGRFVDLVAVEVAHSRSVVQGASAIDREESFKRHAINWDRIDGIGRSRKFARQVAQSLTDIEPDVVLMQGWYGAKNLAALHWCLANRVPSIVASDSNENDIGRLQWREGLKRRVVALYSAGWAAGVASGNYLKRLGMTPERIAVGPLDTIDVSHFMAGAAAARRQANETRQRLDVPNDYFLAVSRFAPEKNLLNLVRAYGLYHQRMGTAAWKLVVVGDGPMMTAVQSFIEDSGLDGSVQLPGWVTFEGLPAYYGLAGAFVHASTRDTWGVVVNEAMAAGLPVIVSNRCGSALEIVREGQNGFTFDPTNVVELSELLWKVAHNTCDLATMSSASRDIIQGWTPKTYAESLLAVANVAVNSPARKSRLLDSALLSLLMRVQMMS